VTFSGQDFTRILQGSTMERLFSEEFIDVEQSVDINRLETLLKERLHGRVYDLRVLARGHGLVLCGDSDSFYGKQLAQHTAMAATGLPIVANDIRVSWR
jgi:hypothetical protein